MMYYNRFEWQCKHELSVSTIYRIAIMQQLFYHITNINITKSISIGDFTDMKNVRALSHIVLLASLIAGCNTNSTQPVESPANTTPKISSTDWRNITNGRIIPDEGYCDQPYIVVNDDGSWVCTMTTGAGAEGQGGQHIISIRSTDRGHTWSEPVDIEPADGPEASWVMPLKVPSGRIYAFYTYNVDNMREVRANTDYARKRVDTLGAYMFRYSDDGGRSWSGKRYDIPMRLMDIDRNNPYGGDVLFFWGVGKPIVQGDNVYFGFSKIRSFGEGFIEESQSCFMKSDNILTEADPEKIRWETLPEGESGLIAPVGPIAEESNLAGLPDGSLYATYRTVDGHPCHAYSRDGGATWTETEYMTYSPGGRMLKHPRAANFIWRIGENRYLYWFHNHGGTNYNSRNPAWITGGIYRDGFMHWSQPEVLLYDDRVGNRMSYPCLVTYDGALYITETQKEIARLHDIDKGLVDGLFSQFDEGSVTSEGLVLVVTGDKTYPFTVDMPELPAIRRTGPIGGVTLDCVVTFKSLAPGQVLFDSRDDTVRGIALVTTEHETVRLILCGPIVDTPGAAGVHGGGYTETSWECDRGLLAPERRHHITTIADGGPCIISFVVDGILCDGGDQRQYGWGRFDQRLGDVNGADTAHVTPSLDGTIHTLRLYNRALRISEAVGNFHAGNGK